LAITNNRNVAFFTNGFVEFRDFFNGVTTVQMGSLNLFFRSVGAGEEKQIIYDRGEFFAFGHTRFDDFAILLRSSCPRQRDFSFTADIGNRCPQFMGEITRKL
jgi:hypothetical protein